MANQKKIFVLDTSVLLHDHESITNFEENYVAIPITVLEELDKFKLGNDTKNFSAREVIRFIDKLSTTNLLQEWISLGLKKGKFKIVMDYHPENLNAEHIYSSQKNDHKIINAALVLQEQEPKKKVVLVTKDINLRIKAKAIGVIAEDYQTGKVNLKEIISKSAQTIDHVDAEVIREVFLKGAILENGILGNRKKTNSYYILKNGKNSCLCFYDQSMDEIVRIEKEYVYGIKPKNAEQAFAFHALLNNNIKLNIIYYYNIL